MEPSKILLNTPTGEIEAFITEGKEIPENTLSLFNFELHIYPFTNGKVKMPEHYLPFRDAFIHCYIDFKEAVNLSFSFKHINLKKAKLIKNNEYYCFPLYEVLMHPQNKKLKFLLVLDINFSTTLFTEGITLEEIQDNIRREMATYRTEFNPNADGGLNFGELYGGSFSSN